MVTINTHFLLFFLFLTCLGERLLALVFFLVASVFWIVAIVLRLVAQLFAIVAHVFAIDARIATTATAIAVFLIRREDDASSPLVSCIVSSPSSFVGTWCCVNESVSYSQGSICPRNTTCGGVSTEENTHCVLGSVDQQGVHLNGTPLLMTVPYLKNDTYCIDGRGYKIGCYSKEYPSD